MGTFYVSLFPIGGDPDPEVFFESYLAAPVVLALYLGYKAYTKNWTFFVKVEDMDLDSGRRDFIPPSEPEKKMSVGRRLSRAVF